MIAGMFEKPPADIKEFFGLNNVSDSLRLGLGWLAQADNVNITDTGAIIKRDGYAAPVAGAYSGIFSTADYGRMYLVNAGVLQSYDGITLATGLTSDPMHWTQINEQVLYNNGTDAGIINEDNAVIPWRWAVPQTPTISRVTGTLAAGTYQVVCASVLADGRETGPSDPVEILLGEGEALSISGITPGSNVYISPANSTVYQLAARPTSTAMVWNASPDNLGRDLTIDAMDPLPLGAQQVCAWKGRIYAAQYFPSENQSVVWFSQPTGFHLFDLAKDYFMVPGQVHMLASVDDGLIVGTESRIYAYTGEGITQLAKYGTIPGQHWDMDGGTLYFWTARGLCTALPFTNLTERQVSVAPGSNAGGAIVRSGGQKRYLVSMQQGGAAFNAFI